MRKQYFMLALALALVCLSMGNLFAQATASATLRGTVMDRSQAVIPNADVKITNKETGLVRTTATGNSGLYRFDLLPAGSYEVRVSVKGFTTAVFESVELAVSQTTNIDAVLAPSQQAEVVTVEASGAALLDVQKTDVSLPISPSQLQDLPTNGRDFANLAYLAPGAKPVDSYDPTKNRIAIFGINGSSGRNVNVTVNGIDNKDNTVGGPVMQFPLEAIQEFNISTQRFSAANGRSEGAAVNVITKAGTNAFHGSLYFFGRSDALNTKNAFEDTKGDFSRQQFGGSVGGPVKKDKDFLFFALERGREQTAITEQPTALNELNILKASGFAVVPSASIPTPYFDWRYNGRFDHRFNDKNNLFVSYSNQNNRGLNDQSAGLSDLTAGNFTTNQLILANATLNSVITPTVVNSFTAGYQYWNNLIDSDQKVPTFTFPGGVTFGTNTNVPQESYQVKWQFRDDISITRGRHAFKTGFDYVWEPKLGGFFIFNPTLEIDFLDSPSTITTDKKNYPQGFATPGAVVGMSATAGNPYFNLTPKQLGLYFQDEWKVRRNVTVNMGLRWDRDFDLIGGAEQAKGRTYLQLKAINSPYAGGLPDDFKKGFSPRIGIAWDVTGHGRHVVRGGYGIYFGQTFINIPLFMLQQVNPTLFATVLSISSSGPGDKTADVVPGTGILLSNFRYGIDKLPSIPPPPTSFQGGEVGRLMDPHYQNPYTQQMNGGYAFQIDSSNLVEVEYVHTLGLHESKTININPKRVALGGARQLDAAFTAAKLPLLSRIDVEESVGRSRYDGLNLSYRRRLDRHFSLNTSYVLSRAVAYNGNSAAFRNRATDVDNIFAAHDFGPTPNDERHHFVVSGIIDLPLGFRIAPIVQAASARPYSSTQGIDVFGFGTGVGSAHAIVPTSSTTNLLANKSASAADLRACLAAGTCVQAPYDNIRGQAFFQWDLRISKIVKIGERAKVDLIFQAFDLTDRANFGNSFTGNIRSSSFGTPNNFITPSGVIVPRSFSGEFGARFSF